MAAKTQPNAEAEVEQYFPGEEPFSRRKRERQRQVALYMTLIGGAVLLVVGVTLRYTLLADAYKPTPYQAPPVAAATPEKEEPNESSASSWNYSRTEGRPDSELSTSLRASYFSDAPDNETAVSASPSPTPAATPGSAMPISIATPDASVGEPVAVGVTVAPIEVVPVPRDITPSVRLFELPDRTTESPKIAAKPKASPKPGAPKAQEEAGGLKVNITAPTITTLPGSLTQPGTESDSGQPSAGFPSAQPGPPAPAPAPPTGSSSGSAP